MYISTPALLLALSTLAASQTPSPLLTVTDAPVFRNTTGPLYPTSIPTLNSTLVLSTANSTANSTITTASSSTSTESASSTTLAPNVMTSIQIVGGVTESATNGPSRTTGSSGSVQTGAADQMAAPAFALAVVAGVAALL